MLRQASFSSQIRRIDDMAAQVDRLRALEVAIPLRRADVRVARNRASVVIAFGGSLSPGTDILPRDFREELARGAAFSTPRPDDVTAEDFEPLAVAAGFANPDLSERFAWGVGIQLQALQAGVTGYRYHLLTDLEELRIPSWPSDLDFPYLALHGADDALMQEAYSRVVADDELMAQAHQIQALLPDVRVFEARSYYGAPAVGDSAPQSLA